MQRWQGRIASSTDQIWPCLSPFSFRSVLVPILETKASARMGSRVIREMIDRLQPQLAAINLEHGYPAQPLKASNVVHFLPLFTHLAQRAVGKSKRVLLNRFHKGVPVIHGRNEPPSSVLPLSESGAELGSWLARPLLLETGLFESRRLSEALSGQGRDAIGFASQWARLVTLELLLREVNRVREHQTMRPEATASATHSLAAA
jgi:hypothetical protein